MFWLCTCIDENSMFSMSKSKDLLLCLEIYEIDCDAMHCNILLYRNVSFCCLFDFLFNEIYMYNVKLSIYYGYVCYCM